MGRRAISWWAVCLGRTDQSRGTGENAEAGSYFDLPSSGEVHSGTSGNRDDNSGDVFTNPKWNQKELMMEILARFLTVNDLDRVIGDKKSIDSLLHMSPRGTTYRGQLADGRVIAVKTLRNSGLNERAFLERVAAYSQLKDENVTPVLAYCSGGSSLTQAVAYEMSARGSLYDALHGRTAVRQKPPVLPWKERIVIAMGIAKGLMYLHHKAPKPAAHGSLKASNVLMCENNLVKLTDFGAFGRPQQQDEIPPHLAARRSLREVEVAKKKADVYALGLLLLELLTGRKPMDPSAPRSQQSLVAWALPRLTDDKVQGIVDPRLKGRYPEYGPLRLGMVAAFCMDNFEFRPDIRVVLTALSPLLRMAMPEPRQEESASPGSTPPFTPTGGSKATDSMSPRSTPPVTPSGVQQTLKMSPIQSPPATMSGELTKMTKLHTVLPVTFSKEPEKPTGLSQVDVTDKTELPDSVPPISGADDHVLKEPQLVPPDMRSASPSRFRNTKKEISVKLPSEPNMVGWGSKGRDLNSRAPGEKETREVMTVKVTSTKGRPTPLLYKKPVMPVKQSKVEGKDTSLAV